MANIKEQHHKINFPVSVTAVDGGWAIAINKKGTKESMLMQPGWKQKGSKPYQFKTQQEAWQFMQRIHHFCSQSNRLRQFDGHHIANCEGCGSVFKTSMSPFCDSCLAEKETIFKQFCEGIYYRTGSSQETLNRLAGMIHGKKTAEEKIKQKKRHQKAIRQAIQQNRYGTSPTIRVSSDYQEANKIHN